MSGHRPSLLTSVFPVAEWLRAGFWRRGWTALFLLAAIAPFVLLQLVGVDDNLHRASIGFSIYFALIWAVAIHNVVRPEPVPLSLLAKVGGFTLIAGVALAISLERHLHAETTSVAKSIFTVGLPEEAAKAAPIVLFMAWRARGTYALRTFLFMGVVSGLVFGSAESISYSRLYAEILELTQGAPGVVVQELWRLLTDGLFHACMAGITAFFIGLSQRVPELRWRLIGSGLLLAAGMHGLYDRFSAGWGGTAIAVAIVFVFVGYVRTGERIGNEISAGRAPAMPVLARQAS